GALARQLFANPSLADDRLAESLSLGGLRFPSIQQVSPAVQVRCARTPAIERESFIGFYDDDFGRDLRHRSRAVRARSGRQTDISVVSIFPAELLGAHCAQIVELFDESQRVVSLHSWREIVVYV